jgi:signal transduction histidine kinase
VEAATVETQARELLARTRHVVVELNQPVPPGNRAPRPAAARTGVTNALALATGLVAWGAVTVCSRGVVRFGDSVTGGLVTVALAFTLGAVPRPRAAVIGLVLCLAGILAAFGLEALPGEAVFAVLAWLAGRLAGSQARLAARLRRTTTELGALQRDEVARARLEERAATAHEVHDSIGHALTAIALQAEAARRLGATRPERAREVLATIGQVAAAARSELRSGFAAEEDLGRLVGGARAAGLVLDVELDESMVPVSLRRVLYRVLQEALTNALRHAPGATGEVRLAVHDDRLALVVRNGPGVRAGEPGSAVGLEGMRRRVEDAGGRLGWECRADGGFELRVEFALTAVPG